MFDQEAFRKTLQRVLFDNADKLLDQRLALMEQEIAEGWECFYVGELWARENLPPPLMNELGQRYSIEDLRVELYRQWKPGFGYGKLAVGPSDYRPQFMSDFVHKPECRQAFRNFLHRAWDPMFDETRTRLREQGRSVVKEIGRTMELSWQHVLHRGRITPEPLLYRPGDLCSSADELLASGFVPEDLIGDGLLVRPGDFSGVMTPDWTLKLMAEMAPDFTHIATINAKKMLMYLQHVDHDLAWAVVFERGGHGNFVNYPPWLSLVWRKDPRDRRAQPPLYFDLLQAGRSGGVRDNSPRGLEVQLLYYLPRFRRQIEFYRPFIEQARNGMESGSNASQSS